LPQFACSFAYFSWSLACNEGWQGEVIPAFRGYGAHAPEAEYSTCNDNHPTARTAVRLGGRKPLTTKVAVSTVPAVSTDFRIDSRLAAVLHSNRMKEGFMARGNASGRTVKAADVPIIMGMIGRGDRHHDIAAWFGFNQGRIKDTQDGKYAPAQTSSGTKLPPKGPPGIKGRLLREEAETVLNRLSAGDVAGATTLLREAVGRYDANEV
jgi:hypothetical protein